MSYSATVYSGVGIGLVETQERAGVSTALLGPIGAAALLAGFFGELLLSPFADRGKARMLLLMSVFAAGLGATLLGLAESIWSLVLGRILVNLGLGTVVPLTYGTLARNNKENRARILAMASGFQYFFHAAGAFGVAAAIDALGTKRSFLALGAVGVSLVPIVFRGQWVQPQPVADNKPPLFAFGLLRSRRLQGALLLAIAFTLPVGINNALWDRYVTDTVQGSALEPNFTNSLTYVLWTMPYVLLTGLGGRLAERIRGRSKVWLVHLPIVLTSVLYGMAVGPISLLGTSALDGALQGLLWPAVMLLVVDSVPEDRSTAAQSLIFASGSLATLLVAFVAPAIYQAHGARGAYLSVGVAMMMVGAVARAFRPKSDLVEAGVTGE